MIKSFDELRRIAFGWLGLRPDDFYRMDDEEVSLMSKGFSEKRKQDQMQFANVAFCVDAIGVMVSGGKPNYKKFISDWFGEVTKPVHKEDRSSRSKEIMKRVVFTNKLLEEKKRKKIS